MNSFFQILSFWKSLALEIFALEFLVCFIRHFFNLLNFCFKYFFTV